jgi:hypothetical protein
MLLRESIFTVTALQHTQISTCIFYGENETFLES